MLIGADSLEGDAAATQELERFIGEGVLANTCDERDLRAEPCRRKCLVGSLPSRRPRERRAAHGLARAWEPLGHGYEIEVDASDDRDPGCRCHGSQRTLDDRLH